jgi:Helicase conserved C-terminal domain
LLRVFEQASIA